MAATLASLSTPSAVGKEIQAGFRRFFAETTGPDAAPNLPFTSGPMAGSNPCQDQRKAEQAKGSGGKPPLPLLPDSQPPAAAIRATPARRAAESLMRSWAWNWSSGRRSLRAMQRKVPAEKASVSAVSRGGRRAAEAADADPEEGRAERDHQREAEVDQVGPALGDPGAEHQADDRQGVGRLVDQRGEEDPPGRAAEPSRRRSAGRRWPGRRRRSGCARPGRRPPPPSAARSPWSPPPGPRAPRRRPGPPNGPGRGRARGGGSGRARPGRPGPRGGGRRRTARGRTGPAAPPPSSAGSRPSPASTASGSMWKNAAPSIAPAAKLR